MIIGIGTTNPAKVAACKAVLIRLTHKLNLPPEYDYIIQNTPSDVPDMPLNIKDIMRGAQNRALCISSEFINKKISPFFTIGLEGGLFSSGTDHGDNSKYFLQSWVYIYDGIKGYWGASGAVPVPKNIYNPIINKGQELADVIDRVAGENDIRSKKGAVGIFTDGLVTRQQFFENALEFAFAPFYNQHIYG